MNSDQENKFGSGIEPGPTGKNFIHSAGWPRTDGRLETSAIVLRTPKFEKIGKKERIFLNLFYLQKKWPQADGKPRGCRKNDAVLEGIDLSASTLNTYLDLYLPTYTYKRQWRHL